MLFARQRLLLTLLDAIGGPVGHTDFQKLLFLYTRECESTFSYDFVPYKFGAFCFTSYADKRKLVAEGLLVEDEQRWQLTDAGKLESRRQAVEPLRVAGFCKRYSHLRGNALIVEQYRRFPYFATRSQILPQLELDAETLDKIDGAQPKPRGPGLLTVGYEGRCLESYLNLLLQERVTLLCDVRRNPLSRKYGFSKSTLSRACEGVGIRYEHLPQLGIDSGQRQNLEAQADYDALFAAYEQNDLPKQTRVLAEVRSWVEAGQRVALTCYEAQPGQCHRHCVAEALERMEGTALVAQHL
jgi:hypothetical protein